MTYGSENIIFKSHSEEKSDLGETNPTLKNIFFVMTSTAATATATTLTVLWPAYFAAGKNTPTALPGQTKGKAAVK